jgi:hypothetical protein
MDAGRIEHLIADLNGTRRQVAADNFTLSQMDGERAALKAVVVAELTAPGKDGKPLMAVTPATAAASLDARLVEQAKSQRTATLARDIALAEAESLRFKVKLALIEAEQDKN